MRDVGYGRDQTDLMFSDIAPREGGAGVVVECRWPPSGVICDPVV